MTLGIIELDDNYNFDTPVSYRQLVRCVECKHGEYREDHDDYLCSNNGICVHNADWFCADGERSSE